MPSYINSYIHRNVQRLEMRGGICLDEEFIYPVLFKGTTSVDYQMATFVLSRENNVTMQEMMAYYNEKEDTDACLRNLELEQFDIDTSLDTQAEDFDLNDIPVDSFDNNYEKLFGELNTPRKNGHDLSRDCAVGYGYQQWSQSMMLPPWEVVHDPLLLPPPRPHPHTPCPYPHLPPPRLPHPHSPCPHPHRPPPLLLPPPRPHPHAHSPL